jgi:hypothetical protein
MSSSSSGRVSTTQQPVQFTGKELEETVVAKIGERDAAMRAAYDAMPKQYPAHAQPDDSKPIDAHAAFRKRLLYRSKQRGW